MTCSEFLEQYWAHYISLEKEFVQTLSYVSLSSENYITYSEKYLKLLLEIGSEVDVVLKVYCSMLKKDFSGERIPEYRDLILLSKPSFFEEEVSLSGQSILLRPWNNKDTSGKYISPFWWSAYNKCKHHRTDVGTINGITKEYFKFANMEYVINGLAGLYQTLIYIYRILAIEAKREIVTPLPGSRIFTLSGKEWESVHFYTDYAFYLREGRLVMECSTVHY